MIFLVSAVSAADVDDTAVISVENDVVDEIQTSTDTEIIADGEDGNNFTSLQKLKVKPTKQLQMLKVKQPLKLLNYQKDVNTQLK